MRQLYTVLLVLLVAFTISAQNNVTYNKYFRFANNPSGVSSSSDSTQFATQNLWWYGPNGYRFSEGGAKYSLKSYIHAFTPSAGDVTGPGSATDNEIPLFNGTTGKLIKSNSGLFSTSVGGLSTVGSDMGLTADGSMIISATDDFIFSTNDELALIAGRTRISSAYVLEGAISPTTLTTNTNDYAPTYGNISSTFRISSTGVVDLTGISVSQIGGMEIILINVGAFTITLKNNVTSTAANRFLFTLGDYPLLPEDIIKIIYDNVSQRWRKLN